MATPKSAVFVRRENGIIFCRIEGWGTMAQGLALRRFAERHLESGDTTLRIDLCDCAYMDSTFLGTLICLNRSFGRRTPDGFTLVNPSPDCRQLLVKMKLDAVLPVCQLEAGQAGDWVELCDRPNDETLQSCVVQAHQELASVPGSAGAPFRQVASLLTKELDAKNRR
jgi:anti-anti-sigma regulatory factor